jgi:hypothetical protein
VHVEEDEEADDMQRIERQLFDGDDDTAPVC